MKNVQLKMLWSLRRASLLNLGIFALNVPCEISFFPTREVPIFITVVDNAFHRSQCPLTIRNRAMIEVLYNSTGKIPGENLSWILFTWWLGVAFGSLRSSLAFYFVWWGYLWGFNAFDGRTLFSIAWEFPCLAENICIRSADVFPWDSVVCFANLG